MSRSPWSNWIGAAVWAAVALVGVSPAAADETADKLTEARVKADQVKSYRASFALTVIEEEKPTTLTGTILYQRPDKRRIEFSTPRPSEDVAQLVVSNGAFEWQYFPATKTVYKTDWATVKAAGVSADTLELRGLHQPFIDMKPDTIRLVETKADGPKTLYVFEAEPVATLVAEAPFTPGTLRVEVSAEDGLTRRLTMTDAQGHEVLSQQYTDVQLNIPVKADQFEFAAPAGAQVVDISEDRVRATQPASAAPAPPAPSKGGT